MVDATRRRRRRVPRRRRIAAAVRSVTAKGRRGRWRRHVKVCTSTVRRGAYEVAQAPKTDFYGAGQQGHGATRRTWCRCRWFSTAARRCRSSVHSVIGAGDRRRRCEAKRLRRSRGAGRVRQRRCAPTRAPRPSGDRQQRDLNGRPPEQQGPAPGRAMGDIIPPTSTWTRSRQPEVPLLGSTGVQGPGRSRSTLTSAAASPLPSPILECVEDTGDGLLAHFATGTEPTIVTPPRVDDFVTRRDRGQPWPSHREEGEMRSRSAAWVGRSTWTLTGTE